MTTPLPSESTRERGTRKSPTDGTRDEGRINRKRGKERNRKRGKGAGGMYGAKSERHIHRHTERQRGESSERIIHLVMWMSLDHALAVRIDRGDVPLSNGTQPHHVTRLQISGSEILNLPPFVRKKKPADTSQMILGTKQPRLYALEKQGCIGKLADSWFPVPSQTRVLLTSAQECYRLYPLWWHGY